MEVRKSEMRVGDRIGERRRMMGLRRVVRGKFGE